MRLLPESNASEKMRKTKSELQRRVQMPKMRRGRQSNEDKRRRGTLGKDHNQTSKNKRERRTNIDDRRISGSRTKRHKRKRDNKTLNNPDTQFNPKTVNSIMGTPEWSIEPRQIYEAQKIKTVERTRIWVREVMRKSKQKDLRIGTQNKMIVPIHDMIDETYVWSWAEVHGETGEWILGSLQHTEKRRTKSKRSRANPENSNPEKSKPVPKIEVKTKKKQREETGKKQSRPRNKNAPRTGKAYRREEN